MLSLLSWMGYIKSNFNICQYIYLLVALHFFLHFCVCLLSLSLWEELHSLFLCMHICKLLILCVCLSVMYLYLTFYLEESKLGTEFHIGDFSPQSLKNVILLSSVFHCFYWKCSSFTVVLWKTFCSQPAFNIFLCISEVYHFYNVVLM